MTTTMTFTFKANDNYKGQTITNIDFDMVDRKTKTFYGNAYFINWANMKHLGRVVVKGTDDAFNKALSLYERGVNLFKCGNEVVVIE